MGLREHEGMREKFFFCSRFLLDFRGRLKIFQTALRKTHLPSTFFHIGESRLGLSQLKSGPGLGLIGQDPLKSRGDDVNGSSGVWNFQISAPLFFFLQNSQMKSWTRVEPEPPMKKKRTQPTFAVRRLDVSSWLAHFDANSNGNKCPPQTGRWRL